MKKLFLWTAVTVIILSMVFGMGACAKAAETTAAETTAAETTAAETTAAETTAAEGEEMIGKAENPDKPVVLNLWTWATSDATKFTDEKVAELMTAKFPNVSVLRTHISFGQYWQMVKTAIAGDDVPDVMTILPDSTERQLREEGQIVNLRPYIEADPDWNQWMEPVRSSGLFYFGEDQQNTMVPLSAQSWAVGYHKEFWPNGFPTTVDGLIEEAARLKAQGIIPLVTGWGQEGVLGYSFIELAYQIDPDPERTAFLKARDGELPWNAPIFIEAATVLKKMWDGGVFSPDAFQHLTSVETYDLYMNKKAAAITPLMEPYIVTMENNGIDCSNMGVTLMPLAKEGANFVQLNAGATSYCVPTQGKHKELALELVKLWAAPEARAVAFGYGWASWDFEGRSEIAPAVKATDLFWAMLDQQKMYGGQVPAQIFNPDTKLALDLALQNILLGVQTIEEALADVQKTAEAAE